MISRALTVIFWNVQDWGQRGDDPEEKARFDRITSVIKKENPDIAVFAEAMDETLRVRMAQALPPGYAIHETTSINPRHIITIFKNAADYNVSITQRDEFKGPDGSRRPFPLIQLATMAEQIAFLPVHSPSGAKTENMARREMIMQNVFKLTKEIQGTGSEFLTLGDMNTMGGGSVTMAEEISDLAQEARNAGLEMISKNYPYTWHGIDADAQYADADFDHVMTTPDLAKRIYPVNAQGDHVRVGGWPEAATSGARDQWVRDYSDHAYLKLKIALKPF
jgi:hypothetical protein